MTGEGPPVVGEPSTPDSAYPQQWEADVVLADGGIAHLRPIRPTDGDLLVRFHGRQSPESVYFRFFSPRPRLSDRQVHQLVNVDYRNRMAFVVLEGEEMIAVARYEPVVVEGAVADEVEVAFFVDDAHNRRGLATILLEYLAVAARQNGRRRLSATVLPENQKMLKVFRAVGFETTSRFSDGYVSVTLDIESDEAGSAEIASRERLAEARSVDRFLTPSSVAVIGGSRPGALGYEIIRHLLDGRFTGTVHPVNRDGDDVHGRTGFASICDIGEPVDIAVIAVSQPDVDRVLDDCIEAGVGGVVVTSAGYSEAGPDGLRAERDLVAKSLRNGLRLLGPNCMGVMNTDEAVRLNGSLVPGLPAPGSIAVSTQSGALGRLLVDGLVQRGLGVSQFVALGNKADISGNDLLQFWELDERTKVILMHLESVGNPGRFQQIARSVSAIKPVIALIPATEPDGADKPSFPSPGDRSSAPPDAWSEVHWPARATLATSVEQAGVVAVESFPELLDAAVVLAAEAIPKGDRVLLIGNSGAALRLAAGEVHRSGLQPVNPIAGRAAALARLLPPGARLENPVDLTFRAEPDHYSGIIQNLDTYGGVDSVVVVHVPPLADEASTRELLAALSAVRRSPTVLANGVCVVACMPDLDGDVGSADGEVPVFGSIHAGIRALAVATRYGSIAARSVDTDHRTTAAPVAGEMVADEMVAGEMVAGEMVADEMVADEMVAGEMVADEIDVEALSEAVRAHVERLLELDDRPDVDGETVLPAAAVERTDLVMALLRSAGLTPVERRLVTDKNQAVDAAQVTGYPVVLKAAERGPMARSQDTGVALDLADETALGAAYDRMRSSLGSAMDRAEVQAMAHAGVDVAVSVHRSMEKGTVITVGRGGTGATPVDNRPVAMLPVDRRQARCLIAESEVGPVVAEMTGTEDAVVDTLVRIAALVDAVPEIVELHLNPVLVRPSAVALTDFELTVARPPTVAPRVRRLR